MNYWLNNMPGKRQGGFPTSDENSMVCDDGGTCDLSIYNTQFVSSEIVHSKYGLNIDYCLEHTPVVIGSLDGIIYNGDTPIQTFFARRDGSIKFSPIFDPAIYAVPTESIFDYNTGRLTLRWNCGAPVKIGTHLVVCYEFYFNKE